MTSDPADLGILDATRLLQARSLSSTELITACLQRIHDRDGRHSEDGDPTSINAWVRVYAGDALAAAAAADRRLSISGVNGLGPPPPLCGVPIGLKDLYAVAGKPLTASSRLLREVPRTDCDVWRRLSTAGMVLLGHTHTHEFAAGGTTDQVGNPWALDRTAGGSSGGSGAALAARMVPAATGTDTAGSLRIPAALCGISTIKPTRGLVSTSGVVPQAPTLDHCGPMARSVADCAVLLAAMAGPDLTDPTTAFARLMTADRNGHVVSGRPLAGVRLAISPRVVDHSVHDDVRDGFNRVVNICRELGGTVLDLKPIPPTGEVDAERSALLCTEMLAFHHRFDAGRSQYRTATREFLELGERMALTAADYIRLQQLRRHTIQRWWQWFRTEQIDALLEPTVPVVAPLRGDGYAHAGADSILLSLAYFWSWTGFPVVSLPAGVGQRSGLPVGVSLVGTPGADANLLRIGANVQEAVGLPTA